MSHFLDGKDKSKAFLFYRVVAAFCPNQGSAEIIDGLLDTFIILLCEQSTKEWSMAITYSKNGFPVTGDARIGGLVRYALIFSKTF